MAKSNKIVLPLDKLVGNKMFIIPERFANEREPETMKKCVLVQIGQKKWYIPTGEPTSIPPEAFAVLTDIGMLSKNGSFEEGEEFDPWLKV